MVQDLNQRIKKKGQRREEDSGHHYFMGSGKKNTKSNGKSNDQML